MLYHDEQNVYDLRQRITGQVRRHPTWSQLEIVWDNLSLQLKTIEDGLAKIDTIVGDVDWDKMPPSASGDGVPAYSTCCWSFATTSPPYTGLRKHEHYHHEPRRRRRVLDGVAGEGGRRGAAVRSRCMWRPSRPPPLLEEAHRGAPSGHAIHGQRLFVHPRAARPADRAGQAQLSSPFDYEKAALVCIPADVPEPGMLGYQRHIEQAMVDLCKASRGWRGPVHLSQRRAGNV